MKYPHVICLKTYFTIISLPLFLHRLHITLHIAFCYVSRLIVNYNSEKINLFLFNSTENLKSKQRRVIFSIFLTMRCFMKYEYRKYTKLNQNSSTTMISYIPIITLIHLSGTEKDRSNSSIFSRTFKVFMLPSFFFFSSVVMRHYSVFVYHTSVFPKFQSFQTINLNFNRITNLI